MKSIFSHVCSCRRTNFKQSDKKFTINLNNKNDENCSLKINCKYVWKFDEIENALLNSPFFVLSIEIILKIFKFLSINDLINISLVCRYFKMIVDQNNSICKINSKFDKKSLYNKGEEKYRYMKIPFRLFISNFGFQQHPNSSTNMIIQLSVDIDKTAHELITLLEKASNKWHKSFILQQMIQRYYRFMKLKIFYPNLFLVPTIDIEIIWQTHLLRPLMYQNDCIRLFNKIIDHSLLLNNIQQSFKQQAFLNTYYLYEKHFNEQYCSLLLYKTNKTSLSRYIYPYFNQFQCLTSIYSYWDETLVQFSKSFPHNYENPFSFTEFDIIRDSNWIDSCKQFMNNIVFNIPNDILDFNPLKKPINLKPSSMKRLKKSYERFLYIAKIYSPIKQNNNYIHPTYAIDIIWHCHMQEPLNYAEDCYRLVGYLIDHYSWSSIRIKQSYKELNQYWKKEFHNDILTDHIRDFSK